MTTKPSWLAAVTGMLVVLLLADWLAAGGRSGDERPKHGRPDASSVGAMRPGAGNIARPAASQGGQATNAQSAPRAGIAGMPNAARQPSIQAARPDLGMGSGGMGQRRPSAAQNAPSLDADIRNRPSVNIAQRPGRDNAAAMAGRPDMGQMRPGSGMQPGVVRPAGLAPAMNRPEVAAPSTRPGMPTVQPGNLPARADQRPGIAGGSRPGWSGGGGSVAANIPGSRPDLGGGPSARPALINRPDLAGRPDGPGGNRPDRPDGNRPDRPDWANRPDRPDGNRPDGNRPGRPDWANRPRPNWVRPGGDKNVTNVTNVTNVNNNYTSNHQNIINNSPTIINSGYRPGIAQPGYGYGYQGNWGYGQNGFVDNSWQSGPGWQPAYRALHDDWHHGSWHGHSNDGNWLNYVAGATTGWLNSWSYGSRLYSWGYTTYSNPYLLTAPQVTTVIGSYDYSQPIDTEIQPPDQNQSAEAATIVAEARAAFKNGNYEQALSLATLVLRFLANDPTVHEFRALNLFAMGRYDEASQTLYPALSVGPGWDWTTMVGLYPDEQTYSGQFTTLERYAQTHPNESAAHFLLAYHYLAVGATDAAAEELRRAIELKPSDRLSRQMLALLEVSKQQAPAPSGPPSTAATPTAPPAAAPSPAPAAQGPGPQPSGPAPAAVADLAGKWKAQSDAKTSITLSLQPDGTFLWEVAHDGSSRQITGKYSLGGDLLTLAQGQGGAMVGNVALTPDNQFTFRLMGAPASEPGLAFARQL